MPGVFVCLGFGFVLEFWVYIRCCGNGFLWFRSYSESLFQTPKRNQKAFAPAYGTSLRLSVPSLRCPPGGIAYGLLRCTSSRCMRLRRTALRAYPLMDTSARPAEGTKDQEPDQEPLTLALSRRERGPTELIGRVVPTCNTALNSGFEKHKKRLPLLGERAGVRGKPTTKTKAEHAPLLPTQNDER